MEKVENIKPNYYNNTNISPFDVIDDWGLDFYSGSIVKYVKRAGKKPGEEKLKDLIKIRTYVDKLIGLEQVKNHK